MIQEVLDITSVIDEIKSNRIGIVGKLIGVKSKGSPGFFQQLDPLVGNSVPQSFLMGNQKGQQIGVV